MRRGSITAAATVALSLALVACSNGGSSTAGAGSGGTPTMGTTSGSSSGSGGGGGYGGYGGYGGGGGNGGGGSSGGGASALTVTQSNYRFSPARITVKSGDTITLTDSDPTTPHNFTVTGSSIDVTNQGGQSQDVTITLKPGTYPFFCQFHQALGMKGTLIVR